MSHQTRAQKFFSCHSRPVTSLSLHPSATACASAQEGPNGRVIIWRVSDCSVLAVLSADLEDKKKPCAELGHGVLSVAFSSSGSSLACICSDPSHTIFVYAVPAISAASFDEENFAQNFGGRVKLVWQWKSKALDVTGIYFDTGPRELPITFGRKHLRFWDITKKARELCEHYQGDFYLLVGEDMGNGFQCCLVLQMPEVSHTPRCAVIAFISAGHTRLLTHAVQITLTGMDNGDIYIWDNIGPLSIKKSNHKPLIYIFPTQVGTSADAGGVGCRKSRARTRAA